MLYKTLKINVSMVLFIATLVISFGGALGVTQASVSVQTEKLLPIYCVETTEKTIAVTFDAAWSAEDTDELISILKKHNARATIFCVGDWVENNKASVKAFYENGHEIANHSDTHADFSKASAQEIKQEIESCNKKIADIIGKKPLLCRAPSGAYDNKSISVCESLGMKMIQWDVDSLDWKKLSVDEMYERATGKVQNGSILLFHNGVENTPEALDRILEKLKKDGYEFVTVSELIYWDNYEIDHTGRQIKA